MSAKSDAERMRAYRARLRGGPPRELKPCGTPAAFRRHERAGMSPRDCPTCAGPYKAYKHALYLRARAARS